MRNRNWILPMTLSLLTLGAHARDSDVEQLAKIFDRKERQLESPPKSLRATGSATDEKRFEEGIDRIQRRIATDATEYENSDENSELGERKVNAPLVPSAASSPESRKGKIVIIRENRREKRQGVLESYSFDGTRAVGIGLVGAGPYGIFGAEFDLSFGSKWSGGFGIGTGMAYSTWGIYGRKYFLEGPISTFLQLGYANWTIGGRPYREKALYPQYLSKLFFGEDPRSADSVRKPVHLIYPATGILFQTKSGLAYSLALQYFINAANFTGALYAGTGMHFYF
jgi:hypothetical protein